MTHHEQKGRVLSSLKYTNILLTIITILLILSVVCKHMNKKRHCWQCKKGTCSVHMLEKQSAK